MGLLWPQLCLDLQGDRSSTPHPVLARAGMPT